MSSDPDQMSADNEGFKVVTGNRSQRKPPVRKRLTFKTTDSNFYIRNNPFGKFIHNCDLFEFERIKKEKGIDASVFNNNHSMYLDVGNVPSLPYDRAYNETAISAQFHWGQRKLLLSEIQLLNKVYKSNKKSLFMYAGAAPGTHLHILLEMFPNVDFLLIDPREMDNSLKYIDKQNTGQVRIIKDFFDDDMAQRLGREFAEDKQSKKYDNLIFVSDIRGIAEDKFDLDKSFFKSTRDSQRLRSDIITGARQMYDITDDDIYRTINEASVNKYLETRIKADKKIYGKGFDNIPKLHIRHKLEIIITLDKWNNVIIENMREQQRWIELMKADYSLLKFRFPFHVDDKFKYLGGEVYMPVYGPKHTTEARLFVERQKSKDTPYKYVDWDMKQYEEEMYYFNTVTRKQYYSHEYDHIVGICHCYDCTTELKIIEEYLVKHKKMKSNVKEETEKFVIKFTNYILSNNYNLLQRYVMDKTRKNSWANDPQIVEGMMTKLEKYLIEHEPLYKLTLNKKIKDPIKEWYHYNRVGYNKWIKEAVTEKIKDDSQGDDQYKMLKEQQRFIQMYMQQMSPYRGILVYHGLGAGKTAASISAIETLMNYRDVCVLTPASLRQNYIEDIRKFGHLFYSPSQTWKFVELKDLQLDLFKKFIDLDYFKDRRGKNKINTPTGLWIPYGVVKEYMNMKPPNNSNVDLSSIFGNNNNNNRGKLPLRIEQQMQMPMELEQNLQRNMSRPGMQQQFNMNALNFGSNNDKSRPQQQNKVQQQQVLLPKTKQQNVNIDFNNINIGEQQQQGGALNLQEKDFIHYDSLDDKSQEQIQYQIEYMIRRRYTFVNYNGLQQRTVKKTLFKKVDGKYISIFDNKVIVIDEVHNLISYVVGSGKIGKVLYELLLKAKNVKIILLSGTPLINSAYELSYLINLIKGNTTVYSLTYTTDKRYSTDNIAQIIKRHPKVDYVDVNQRSSTIKFTLANNNFTMTSNMKSKYLNINPLDLEVFAKIAKIANLYGITILDGNKYGEETFEILPTNKDEFNKYFVNPSTNEILNKDLLSRILIGTTSFFESKDSDDYPSTIKNEPIKVELSGHQYATYVAYRRKEIEKEKKAMEMKDKFGGDSNTTSVYRVFTRIVQNFAFPEDIERPMPSKIREMEKEMGEKSKADEADAEKEVISRGLNSEENTKEESQIEVKVNEKTAKMGTYERQIKEALDGLRTNKNGYLTSKLQEYSPKFYKMIESINKSPGPILFYSNFRNVEGVGVFALTLEANGYAELDIIQDTNTKQWSLNMKESDYKKEKFIVFSLDPIKARVLLAIFNNNKNNIPSELRRDLEKKLNISYSKDNMPNLRGELVKAFLITKAGSEGISLQNVRQVHILEPYWNHNRGEQVVGRARRFQSHKYLPKNERNIEVFSYISVFSKKQINDAKKKGTEYALIFDKYTTTDEYITGLADRKRDIIEKFQTLMKQTSVDCGIYKDGEKPDCYKVDSNALGKTNTDILVNPDIKVEYSELEMLKMEKDIQKKVSDAVAVKLEEIKVKGVKFYYNEKTGSIYQKIDRDVVRKIGSLEPINKKQMKWKVPGFRLKSNSTKRSSSRKSQSKNNNDRNNTLIQSRSPTRVRTRLKDKNSRRDVKKAPVRKVKTKK
jgi:hypothetical protein